MILDLRGEDIKRKVLQAEEPSTLKKIFDIWQDRPSIVAAEATDFPDFSHKLHHLEAQNQILHIVIQIDTEAKNEAPKMAEESKSQIGRSPINTNKSMFNKHHRRQ